MRVVMTASECAPIAQAGGLGEVVYGLSREIELRGHTVDVILPKYDCMRYDLIHDLRVEYDRLDVPWYRGQIPVTVWTGTVQGRRCFFIEPHSADRFFERGELYGSPDDITRFAFFSRATVEFLYKSGRRPDVIHCHDWQTALVPVLLYEMYAQLGMPHQRVCFTVHNFSHQGIAREQLLWETGLTRPAHFFHDDRMLDNFDAAALNLMKGGIIYSNYITTVSPQHAWEAQFRDAGAGLGHTLHLNQHKFRGVLNGVDYDVWNPEIDPLIPNRYSVHDLAGKYENKAALRDRFWMRQDFKPVIAYVGRLDQQKGVHLIRHAIAFARRHRAQFVLLGSSTESATGSAFARLKQEVNDDPDCHLELSFSPELAHLIYAGSDLVVVPSLFEPCGLTPLIGLQYGTIPVVRHIGGLVDTVHDRDYSDRPWWQRNGYVFHEVDEPALESALVRAIGLWYGYPSEFQQLIRNGMSQDFSWAGPGAEYVQIYDHIKHA